MSDGGELHLHDKFSTQFLIITPISIYTANNVIHALENGRGCALDIYLFHFLIQQFSVRAREKIALSTLPAKQRAQKHVKICVTPLQHVALCDLRVVLAQTAQYCMMGNVLNPEAVHVTWRESTTSLGQLL